MKNFVRHSFSSTAELLLGENALFIKHFSDLPRFTVKDFDISPIYGRDRVSVSLWAYNAFQDHSPTRKYFPALVAALPQERILITKSVPRPHAALNVLLNRGFLTKQRLTQIQDLTRRFAASPIYPPPHVPAFLKNGNVLSLKMNLQFQKPLAALFSSKKAREATLQLRKRPYCACLGDLQPKNILVAKNSLYLVDFEEAFIGPLGWDIGFLWGNMLYDVGHHNLLLARLTDTWQCLMSKMRDPMRRNALLVSSATIAMRLFLFPALKLNAAQQEQLKRTARHIFHYA